MSRRALDLLSEFLTSQVVNSASCDLNPAEIAALVAASLTSHPQVAEAVFAAEPKFVRMRVIALAARLARRVVYEGGRSG